MIDIEAIKARAEAATKGPWEVVTSNLSAGGFDYEGYFIPDYLDVVSDYYIGEVAPFDSLEDAVFVAHAHGDIMALVAEVERLRGIVDRVREVHVPTEMYPSGIIACKECCSLPNACYTRHKAYGNTCQYPCPTIRALEGE